MRVETLAVVGDGIDGVGHRHVALLGYLQLQIPFDAPQLGDRIGEQHVTTRHQLLLQRSIAGPQQWQQTTVKLARADRPAGGLGKLYGIAAGMPGYRPAEAAAGGAVVLPHVAVDGRQRHRTTMAPCVPGLDHRILRADQVEHVHQIDVGEIGLKLGGDADLDSQGVQGAGRLVRLCHIPARGAGDADGRARLHEYSHPPLIVVLIAAARAPSRSLEEDAREHRIGPGRLGPA